jgi:hypothetical protein
MYVRADSLHCLSPAYIDICTACYLQASRCFVLDIDQRAFLAAIKDRKSAGLPITPPALPAAAQQPDSSGPVRELLIDAATMAGIRTSSGFSNASWPVGKEVLDFFWGELALSEGAPFECLTPDGQAKVRVRHRLFALA